MGSGWDKLRKREACALMAPTDPRRNLYGLFVQLAFVKSENRYGTCATGGKSCYWQRLTSLYQCDMNMT